MENRVLSGGYFILSFQCQDGAGLGPVQPGQFVMLRGDWGRDLLNPRAFSVLATPAADRFSVLLKVFGRGTARMRNLRSGDTMTVTGPLGIGFPPPRPQDGIQLLVAGGVGLPPLHLQARAAADAGYPTAVEVLYGGRTSDELVLLQDFESWGVPFALATEDGSKGTRGRVTDLLSDRLKRAQDHGESVTVLACGPTPMLRVVRAIGLQSGVRTLLCLEEEMACGFGVCLGCAVPVYGPKPYRYCCTDGPVFDGREVRWS